MHNGSNDRTILMPLCSLRLEFNQARGPPISIMIQTLLTVTTVVNILLRMTVQFYRAPWLLQCKH